MIKLLEGGAYLLNGREIIAEGGDALNEVKAKTGKDVSREAAKQATIAYDILKSHNTSDPHRIYRFLLYPAKNKEPHRLNLPKLSFLLPLKYHLNSGSLLRLYMYYLDGMA